MVIAEGNAVSFFLRPARAFLRRKEPFVFNATNLSAMIRGKWIQLFHQYGARVRIVYLETGWTERERRNASRADRGQGG